MMRLAMVVQRYGAEVCGGAETEARMLAEHLVRHHAVAGVDVLTTCAREDMSGRGGYRPGQAWLNGVRVERFPGLLPPLPRLERGLDRAVFAFGARALEPLWLALRGPWSPGLVRRLRQTSWRYDAVIVFTYLWWPTVASLPLVANRSILVPTAHDEPALGLSIFEPVFTSPAAIAFNTPEEQDLVRRRFAVGRVRQAVVGCGVELAPAGAALPPALRGRPYVLFLGRHDKRLRELIGDFGASKRALAETPLADDRGRPFRAVDLVLAVAGRGTAAVSAPDVVDVGFVDERTKRSLLEGALVLLQPSRFESLSLTMLEAWTLGRPVLADRGCAVSAAQILRAGGGFTYAGTREFTAGLRQLLTAPTTRAALGAAGAAFVAREYQWPAVTGRMVALAAAVAGGGGRQPRVSGD